MAVSNRVRSGVRARPATVTVVLSLLGYGLVGATFVGLLPYPDLPAFVVEFLTHSIAVINSLALAALLAGVYFIRNRKIAKHRAAMLTAFSLILLFLVAYLLKVGGGFEKTIVAPDLVTLVYLVMLAIHIFLSVVAMPVVLHAVVLGSTHSPAELEDTSHALVGRIGAGAWILSLALGIVTYVMLNHIFGSVPRETALLVFLACPRPQGWRE